MCRMRTVIYFLAAAILLVANSNMTAGQDAPPAGSQEKPQSSDIDGIKQDKPGFLVCANVDRAGNSYREGDLLTIQAACEVDAYLYVLYKQADGKVFQIFPNSSQPENRVKARQAVAIPGPDDLFRWVIGPPFGKEIIKVIASKEPLKALSDPEFRRQRFNPVAPEKVKGIELELGQEQPPPWAEDAVEIQTYPKNRDLPESNRRRYALCIGISKYEMAEAHKSITGKDGFQSVASNRDARRMASILAELGEIGNYRILTDDQATRNGIEEAITGWLPAVSRPGDTVFIYYSGLVSLDMETKAIYLEPYDFISSEVLRDFFNKLQAGKLERYLIPRVEELFNLARQYPNILPSGRNVLPEVLGVSDIVLAHWLQRLAGRQVVLIFDAPGAGFFAPKTKGDLSVEEAPAFKSLQTDIARLKDLGQGEIALLAGTSAQGEFVSRESIKGGMMTVFLCDAIANAAGPLTLEQAHQIILKRVDEEQQQSAQGGSPRKLNRPLLFNTCTKPVYVRP